MKKRFLSAILCVLLALPLFGCTNGRGQTTKDPGKQDALQSTDTNATKTDVMGGSAVGTDTDNRTKTQLQRSNAISWEQMLQNGHVRDQDGRLWDGENNHW